MPFKSPNCWSKNICSLLAFGIFLAGLPLYGYPDRERDSTSLSEPPLNPVTSQATDVLLEDDDFLFLSFGGQIERIDLATWSLASEQVPDLADNSDESGGEDLRGDIAGIAIRGDFLYASQSDGDLLIIDLDDIDADPDSVDLGSSSFGPLAADPEAGIDDDKLYILDKTKNSVEVYDISDGAVVRSIPLKDSLGNAVTPREILFVDFPTAASSASVDKIYVTSDRGLLFVAVEGASTVSQTVTLSATNKELPALATSPEGNFLLVVNATDAAVHVVSTATDTEVDTDTSSASVTPISLSPNTGLISVAVTDVTGPVDTYAFVTGSGGVSVIDLNLATSSFSGFERIDFNDEGSEDDEDDPMDLSASPGLILASPEGDYLLTSNSNATLSVISDNPFVNLISTSLGSETLTEGGSFTITFQSDEAGSYVVRVGGTIEATGSQVASGTVSTADSDLTTDAITYDASVFSEGTNRLFVFVTDGEGNLGWDATEITVDTPPGGVTIREVAFGNSRVYLTFTRLTAADIDHYNIYADTDAATVGTKDEVTATVAQPSSGETVVAEVGGLANGTSYFLAVAAVDAAGNVGGRTTTLESGGAATAQPEITEGITASFGEGGCSLLKN